MLDRLDALGLFVRPARGAEAAEGERRRLQRLPVVEYPPIVRPVVDVTRESSTARSDPDGEGVSVAVEFSADERFDTPGGRWLKAIVEAARAAREVGDDDTPVPNAQRTPVLPPPDSSPMQASRR